MSTSLAEQLKRLAQPQTSQIVDTKFRASILFDPKEAAAKDRETIFDIGRSGLHEIASLNPTFLQFEQTLFSRAARDFVRNVENSEANRDLNKVIRKFLFHLSPHFLLQPAHKCLEWLIRRFQIHEYNVDEFIMLILPYHETRMFVKCVQIMPKLRDERCAWHWLASIQKPGCVLSKPTLFSRAATDAFLLRTICKFTNDAVRELDMRAYTLQALFAFYCTTVLGALDAAADVTNDHISNVFPTLARGLSSSVVDFCAATMMITGQLMVRCKLTIKFLDSIVPKLARIQHPGLQSEAILLLVLIYQTQSETLRTISIETLVIVIESKWIPSALAACYGRGISILPFYMPLMTACLKMVQLKESAWKLCKTFCQNLLAEVVFTGEDAELMIRYD